VSSIAEYIGQVPHAGLLFILVFILNVMPAFAPPTWITLSFLGLSMPHVPIGALALIGATAATLGRVTLAKLSRAIVRRRFLDEPTCKNIGAIKDVLEKRRVFAFGTFLAYAFSPLPSNYLFIAYGLTTLRLTLVAFPFFVGRLASYSFWVTTASVVGDRLDLDSIESLAAFEEGRLRWFRAT
jgi:hypothetical protein